MNPYKDKIYFIRDKVGLRFERFNVLILAIIDLADQNQQFYEKIKINYILGENLQSAATFMLRGLRDAESELTEAITGGEQ